MSAKTQAREDERSGEPPRDAYELPRWSPIKSVTQGQLAVAALLVVVLFFVATVVPYLLGWISEDTLRDMGIPGIFLANLISTASLIPIPGSSAVGQVLIVAGASTLWKPGVFAAALLGMTIGESTAYLAGFGGRHVAEEKKFPFEDTRFGDWMHGIANWISRAMSHPQRAFGIVAVISGIPNPFFDVVGITAGATRMNFWLFLLAVALGDCFRVLLLIWLGDQYLDFSGIFEP